MSTALIRRHTETEVQRGEGHVTTEAGIGVMHLQAKGHQGLLEPPEAGRGKEPSKAVCLIDADRTWGRNEGDHQKRVIATRNWEIREE